MGDESVKPASTPTGAVFLSYASQDAAAAQRICEALRADGIEVWFDQSELRGGDAWDGKIRDQIHDCRLFIPIISANTERRDEGYFRREWALATDRTRDMVHKRTFIVPVVIDGTPERGASVPEKFHELHWTRLEGGGTQPAFVQQIRRLLTPDSPVTTVAAGSTSAPIVVPSGRRLSMPKGAMWSAVGIVVLACAYLVADKFWSLSTPPPGPAAPTNQHSAPPVGAAVAFNPPAHSLAVLPFVNLSGDKEQEYFSDGLTEELLNSLAQIDGLRVAARTSSFSFREHPDIASVAHKLNVATVLEGSVRRSANTLRVTAQLINAVTGFHQWSKTYDRDLGDVLKLQTEIATAVAAALKVALLGDVAAKIELGGTHNPAAFDAYLRGSRPLYSSAGDAEGLRGAINAFTEATRLDPNYALAFAGRSLALGLLAAQYGNDPTALREGLKRSLGDAHQAIALAPELAEGYRALATFEASSQQFESARAAFERALALAPGDARLLPEYARFTVLMGRADAGIEIGRRAVVLDRLNPRCHQRLGESLYFARRY